MIGQPIIAFGIEIWSFDDATHRQLRIANNDTTEQPAKYLERITAYHIILFPFVVQNYRKWSTCYWKKERLTFSKTKYYLQKKYFIHCRLGSVIFEECWRKNMDIYSPRRFVSETSGYQFSHFWSYFCTWAPWRNIKNCLGFTPFWFTMVFLAKICLGAHTSKKYIWFKMLLNSYILL